MAVKPSGINSSCLIRQFFLSTLARQQLCSAYEL
jgi:hypothetical protein